VIKEAEPAQGGQRGPDFRTYSKQVTCLLATPFYDIWLHELALPRSVTARKQLKSGCFLNGKMSYESSSTEGGSRGCQALLPCNS
jgi:hypothetical protein